MRAIRDKDFLYIRNFEPDRWPSLKDSVADDGPSFDAIMASKTNPQTQHFFEQAVGRRPAEELYAVADDPYQLNNIVADPNFAYVKKRLQKKLITYLSKNKDPRIVGKMSQ